MRKHKKDYREFKGIVGIYKITRKSTGQMYIGQSVRDIHERWKNHIRTPCETSYIDNAINKYGEEEFELELLENLNYIKDEKLRKEKANELEIYYIDKFNTFKDNFHYNLTVGGEGSGTGKEHPNFKDYPRIMIDISQPERPYYYIYYYHKKVLYSYDKSILQKYIDDGTWIKLYEGKDIEFIKKEKEKLKITGKNHGIIEKNQE